MDREDTIKDTSVLNIKDSYFSAPDFAHKRGVYKSILFKMERITSAIHLVTGLMDNKETLRWSLRDASIGAVSDLYSSSDMASGGDFFVSDIVLKRVGRIIALLDVGLTAGLISQMNSSILKEECHKLRDVICKYQIAKGSDPIILPPNFFGSEIAPPSAGSMGLSNQVSSNIKDKNRMSLTEKNRLSVSPVRISGSKDDKRQSDNDSRIKRRDSIMEIMKDKMSYTIKDIIDSLASLSDGVDRSNKTIQRDLLSLVAEGVLKKTGERRWSRYSRV